MCTLYLYLPVVMAEMTLHCVEWGVKLYSNQPSQLYACCHVSFLVHFQVLMSYVIFTGRLLMVMSVQLSCISCMYIMYICVCVCVCVCVVAV